MPQRMIQTKTWNLAGSNIVEWSNEVRSKNAVVFLHGFPADSGKNEDIAHNLAEEVGVDSFLLHFKGLGQSSGLFSFQSSIEEAMALSSYLKAELGYSSLFLVGHSWGGLVAMNLLRRRPEWFGSSVLMAPYCLMPEAETVEEIVRDFISSELLLRHNTYDASSLTQDFNRVAADSAPLNFASEMKLPIDHVLVVQGTNDEVSVPFGAGLLVDSLKGAAKLIEIDDDHWFKDRGRISKLVKEWLGRKV
jgi:pimeloyl-ACP methyl ester carboxylesterase